MNQIKWKILANLILDYNSPENSSDEVTISRKKLTKTLESDLFECYLNVFQKLTKNSLCLM